MPIGTYRYGKWIRRQRLVTCRVTVFPMEVTEELADWPARAERTARWFSPSTAAQLVTEAEPLGRGACRGSVCPSVSISVAAAPLKKKTQLQQSPHTLRDTH